MPLQLAGFEPTTSLLADSHFNCCVVCSHSIQLSLKALSSLWPTDIVMGFGQHWLRLANLNSDALELALIGKWVTCQPRLDNTN